MTGTRNLSLIVGFVFLATVTSAAWGAIGNPVSSVLLNKYNDALPYGKGSANILTESPGTITGCQVANGDNGGCLVSGNFHSEHIGPGGDPAVDVGGALQPNGFYGHTTDPDSNGEGSGAAWVPFVDPGNNAFVTFTFYDGPHTFDWMQLWNLNEITPNAGMDQPLQRSTKLIDIHYSAEPFSSRPPVNGDGTPGAGWISAGQVELPIAGQSLPSDINADTASGAYTGESYDLGGFTATHIMFDVVENYAGEPFSALSEVQFYAVPEASSLILLLGGLPFVGLFARKRQA